MGEVDARGGWVRVDGSGEGGWVVVMRNGEEKRRWKKCRKGSGEETKACVYVVVWRKEMTGGGKRRGGK